PSRRRRGGRRPGRQVPRVRAVKGAIASRVPHLRVSLTVSFAVLVAAALVGGLVAGATGALGAAVGVCLVVASYVPSTLAIAWADAINPQMVFGVGMGMYVTKFSLFGLLLIALGSSDWAGTLPMAWGIVAGVIAWTATQIWWTTHVARRT